jgi:cell division protein FtsL
LDVSIETDQIDISRPGKLRTAAPEALPWFLPTGAFAIVTVLVMVFLCQYALLIRSHYQVVAMKERQRVLERERDLMELQLQSLSSLERVEKVAISRLGMVPPAQRQVLDLRKVHNSQQVAVSPAAKN